MNTAVHAHGLCRAVSDRPAQHPGRAGRRKRTLQLRNPVRNRPRQYSGGRLPHVRAHRQTLAAAFHQHGTVDRNSPQGQGRPARDLPPAGLTDFSIHKIQRPTRIEPCRALDLTLQTFFCRLDVARYSDSERVINFEIHILKGNSPRVFNASECSLTAKPKACLLAIRVDFSRKSLQSN